MFTKKNFSVIFSVLFSFFFFYSVAMGGVEEEWRAGWKKAVEDSEEADKEEKKGGGEEGWLEKKVGGTLRREFVDWLFEGWRLSLILSSLFLVGIGVQWLFKDSWEGGVVRIYYSFFFLFFLAMGLSPLQAIAFWSMFGAHRLYMDQPKTGGHGLSYQILLGDEQLMEEGLGRWAVSALLALAAFILAWM